MKSAVKKGMDKVMHPFEKRVEEAHQQGFFGSMTMEQVKAQEKSSVSKHDDPSSRFPDMSNAPTEKVTKRWYNWDEKKWESGTLVVKIMPKMFAEGALRTAHYMLVIHPDGTEEKCVAKWNKEKQDQKAEVYDTDVIMQAACQAIAKAFNARKPPRPVHFVDCYTIQRQDRTWWSVETFIPGKYVKHNNNWGFVEKGSRNTPQAFTHFSYEFTEGRMMIVDIQGVNDVYTDPQVHTIDGKGYGVGNMGEKGMEQFLKTHWCNSVCSYLCLEFHAPVKSGGAMYQAPRREGTCAIGKAESTTDAMKVSDFIGNLMPVVGSASKEDLAILGLKPAQFDALVREFNNFDKDHSGFLDKAELFHLFQKAEICASKGKETEEFLDFVTRVQTQINHEGKISFKSFVLCWTDNQ
jgi:hypothetical protein